MPRTARVLALVTAAVLAVALAGCTSSSGSGSGGSGSSVSASASASAGGSPESGAKPNIVFVLTDDLARNLVPYMPQVRKLQQDGMSFDNYTVTDSLCCPSRSSILTGKFPHDTGVFTNNGNDGGFRKFHSGKQENATYGTALQAAGYQTAFMGKYLNGYQPGDKLDGAQPYVPPGWNEWDVAGAGYAEFNYDMNENHKVVHHGKDPQDYLTDVVSGKAQSFIKAQAGAHQPFAIEVATFAPHGPYTPAPRDANKFPGLKAPRTPAYDKLPANAPSWLASRQPLGPKEQMKIDNAFRKRAQAVQAVDKMIGDLRSTLSAAGVADNTIVVFSSDNGYHMGDFRLQPGKQTAFDTDVNVPLVLAGPGIKAGVKTAEPASNIDLTPTFEALAGARTPDDVDGHSLLPVLHSGGTVPDWRTTALVEHHGPDKDRADPDFPAKGSGNPTTYEAIRTATYTYVEYKNGDKEYYDRKADPYELSNTATSLSADRLAKLHAALAGLQDCHTGAACWTAGHAAP